MFAILSALLTTAAFAQSDTDKPTVTYQKETTIEFGELDIEGRIVKPDGKMIVERPTAFFNPLIRLRTDFQQEIRSTVNDL